MLFVSRYRVSRNKKQVGIQLSLVHVKLKIKAREQEVQAECCLGAWLIAIEDDYKSNSLMRERDHSCCDTNTLRKWENMNVGRWVSEEILIFHFSLVYYE